MRDTPQDKERVCLCSKYIIFGKFIQNIYFLKHNLQNILWLCYVKWVSENLTKIYILIYNCLNFDTFYTKLFEFFSLHKLPKFLYFYIHKYIFVIKLYQIS